jgi:hypothetical protein
MAVPNGGGTSSDNPSSRAPIAFPDFRLFDSAQDILDHNKCVGCRVPAASPLPVAHRGYRHLAPLPAPSCRRIIKEIKVNHEAQTPEALARNCPLIRELNTNIAAVRLLPPPHPPAAHMLLTFARSLPGL